MKRRKDLISGSFLLLLGLFMAIRSFEFGIWGGSGPRAGFFPLILGVIIILLSLILLLQSSLSKRIQEKTKTDSNEAPESKTPMFMKVSSYALSILLYGLLMKSAGFFIITFLFLAVILKYVEGHRWGTTLLLGLTTTLVSYLLFNYWLGVPLPQGFILGLIKDLLP